MTEILVHQEHKKRTERIILCRESIRPRKSAFTFALLKFPNDPGKSVSTSFMEVFSNLTPTESAENLTSVTHPPQSPVHLTEIKVCKRVGVISPSLDGVCKT